MTLPAHRTGMSTVAPVQSGLNLDRARELLAVAPWQLDLAAKTGLLRRHPSGGFDEQSVRAAKARRKGWLADLEAEYRLTAGDAAKRLGVSPKAFAKTAMDEGLVPLPPQGNRKDGTLFYRAGDIDDLVRKLAHGNQRERAHHIDIEEIAREYQVTAGDVQRAAKTVHARVQRQSDGTRTIMASREPDIVRVLESSTRKKTDRPRAISEAERVAAAVRVWVRDRQDNPSSVTLHLGPTNSGKTYDALRRLAGSRSGVYAAPLRMLAREAYEKLCDLIGPDSVGLITGEEQINDTAPVICCTAEMAPMQGTTLVLDEAHWAADIDRGYAWTRLLVGGAYDVIEVAASRGATGFLEAVFADVPHLDIQQHDRLSPLSYGGEIGLAKIPNRSLVVAFSRKAVHALAKRLLDQGRSVGVLYGALPPETRIDQINAFIDGDVDVLVVTDVVGHGINTPAEAVVFAQTDKFDGVAVRDLRLWETAQIAGRAGRFGLGGAGKVYALTGQPGFNPKAALVKQGANAAAGKEPDGLKVERGLLRPTYRDLAEPAAHQLGVALTAWARVAERELAERPGVEAVPVEPLIVRWEAAGDVLAIRPTAAGLTREWPVDGELAWRIVTTPVDIESPAFEALVASVAEKRDRFEPVLKTARILANSALDAAESAASTARDLMVIARVFPDIRAGLYEEAAQLEQKATVNIERRLAAALRTNTFGECENCGRACAPHFTRCDHCHQTGRQPRPAKKNRRA